MDSRGPNKAYIRWEPRSPSGGAIIGKRTCRGMPYDTLPWAVQHGWTDRDAVWVMDSGGPKKACYYGGPNPHAKRKFVREKTCLGMSDDTLWWAVQRNDWIDRDAVSVVTLWARVGSRNHTY